MTEITLVLQIPDLAEALNMLATAIQNGAAPTKDANPIMGATSPTVAAAALTGPTTPQMALSAPAASSGVMPEATQLSQAAVPLAAPPA